MEQLIKHGALNIAYGKKLRALIVSTPLAAFNINLKEGERFIVTRDKDQFSNEHVFIESGNGCVSIPIDVTFDAKLVENLPDDVFDVQF